MTIAVPAHQSGHAGLAAPARTRGLPNWLLVPAMFLAVALVASLAYWDEERESGAALDDLAREQAAFATGVELSLRTQLDAISRRVAQLARGSNRELGQEVFREPDFILYVHHVPPQGRPLLADSTSLWVTVPWDGKQWLEVALNRERLLSGLRSVEELGRVRVLVQQPERPGLVSTHDRTLFLSPLEELLASGASTARLARQDAGLLGLPVRTAIAGLASFAVSGLGKWGIAVVSTAQGERDRQIRAKWRLLLAVLLATGLIVGFGGLALRKQRRELELSRELAIAAAEHARDERLQQADKLATLGALATGIAHEVSTPLGVILGRAEQLSSRLWGDERSQRALETIAFQTERISGVLRGFLSLARGDGAHLQRVAPESLVLASIDLVEHRFKSAGVELTANIGRPLPMLACEPHLFGHVLVNLLLNARESCQVGGHVELAVRSDGERVAFVVTDDGKSIPPEAASRAMEPFFSAGHGRGGLGLAIANEIVKHHHGALAISPREQGGNTKGTRAVVEIPAQDA